MKKLLILMILLLSTVFCDTNIQYLHKYIGTYQHKNGPLFTNTVVEQELKSTFGTKLPHLLKNLETKGPVDFISGNIVITGNAPHMGGSEMAILVIDTYKGKVHGAIFSEGSIEIFSGESKYQYIPIALKDWLIIVNSDLKHRSTKPVGVEWNK